MTGDSTIASAMRDGWQPIETAPRDGTRVLLAHDEWVGAGAWCKEGNGNGPFWTDYSVASWPYEEYAEIAPSHWMPLPDAPVSA